MRRVKGIFVSQWALPIDHDDSVWVGLLSSALLVHPKVMAETQGVGERVQQEAVARQCEGSFPDAALLALEVLFTLAGGYLDAYAYIGHGHVFTNAQTGNVILFAVSATKRKWAEALPHVPPILASVAGIACARLLGARSQKRTFRATIICQWIEISTIGLLLVLGNRFPGPLVVPMLAFVAAIQFTSFDAVGPWKFNNAMTTGNLKAAVEGLVFWYKGEQQNENRGQVIVSFTACVSFITGALLGAFCTHLNARFALAPCAGLLLLALALTYHKHRAAAISNVSAGRR